jgi:hypothetical protein
MIIENKKLYDLAITKESVGKELLAVIEELEVIEKDIKEFERQEKEITASVIPDETLKAEGDALVEVFNNTLKRLEEIGKQIEAKKLEAIPKEMEESHKDLMKKREEKERERNKLALKMQKCRDKMVPILKKDVRPSLEEYGDVEKVQATEDNKVEITTFNYLEDFKRKFKYRD